MSASAPGDGESGLARRVAATIFQRVVAVPLLAVFTAVSGALALFVERVGSLGRLVGELLATPIRLPTTFGSRLLEDAARISGLAVADLELVAFPVAIAIALATLAVVAWGVNRIG